jgi:hypothetical protein
MIHQCPCGFATDDGLWFESHQAQHVLKRDHDVSEMTTGELERARRDLEASLAPTPAQCVWGSDIYGLVLCAEHAGVPYDLLAAALAVQPARLRAIVARWRQAGYAATGRLGPGPAWCWLTAAGMAAAGLGYPAGRPPLARLAHLRAVLAARLWFQASPAWGQH